MHRTKVILTIFIWEGCFDASGPPIAHGHLLIMKGLHDALQNNWWVWDIPK